MSFYTAHAALGNLALVRHDTAAALGEYAQAVDLAGGEPGLRYRYGVALFEASKFSAAADQFRKSVELDPYYAKPYFPLAYILEGSGKMELGDDVVDLEPGVTIVIEPGTPHRAYGDITTIVIGIPAQVHDDEFFVTDLPEPELAAAASS